MTLERKDLEEVGEAVEALGIMLERQLGVIQQRLVELYRLLAQSTEDDNDSRGQTKRMDQHIAEIRTSLEQLGNIQSRTESRLADLQTGLSDEEDLTGDVKSDLLAIRRDLQLLRSDVKELLEGQESAKRSRDEYGRGSRESENEPGQDATL